MPDPNTPKPFTESAQKLYIGTIYTVVTAAGLLTLRKVFDLIRRKYHNLPPGPVGIPIWGKTHDLGNKEALIKARERYGVIHLTTSGFATVCFINEFNLLKNLFNKHEFEDRSVFEFGVKPHPFSILPINDGWQHRRKLFSKNIVNTLNSRNLATLIESSLKNHLFPMIDNCIEENKTWFIRNETNYTAFTTVYHTIFGKYGCPSPHDELYIKFIQGNDKMVIGKFIFTTDISTVV